MCKIKKILRRKDFPASDANHVVDGKLLCAVVIVQYHHYRPQKGNVLYLSVSHSVLGGVYPSMHWADTPQGARSLFSLLAGHTSESSEESIRSLG